MVAGLGVSRVRIAFDAAPGRTVMTQHHTQGQATVPVFVTDLGRLLAYLDGSPAADDPAIAQLRHMAFLASSG
jgi:hypothetical protein